MTTQFIIKEKISQLVNEIGGDIKLSNKILNLVKVSEYSRVFTNEIINALRVARSLLKGEINIVLQAPMQSGKSGTINQLCNLILKEIRFIKSNQGVVFVNSMTDKSLYSQNIINLGGDRSSIKVMKMKDFKKHGFIYVKKNNIKLIVRDEDQYGCGEDSSFDSGFFDKLRVNYPEIPLVTVSATPFDVLDAMEKNSVKGDIISGVTGENYFGIKDMLNLDLVKDLAGDYSHIVPNENGFDTISKEIQECVFHLKKYESSIGIIRASKTINACYLKDQLKSLEKSYNFNIMVIGSRGECDESISDGLEKLHELTRFQKKNTILIIIGALSAGQDLKSLKEKVKFIIETRRLQLSNVVQGLPGRICGYHPNRDCLVYANKSILEKYVEFEDDPNIFNTEEFKNVLKRDEKIRSISTQTRLQIEHREGLYFPIKSVEEFNVESLYNRETEEKLSFLSEESFKKILSFFNRGCLNNQRTSTRVLNHENVNVRLASNYKKNNYVYSNWNKKQGDNFKDIFPNKQKNVKYGILVSNFPLNHEKNLIGFCGIKLFISGKGVNRSFMSNTKNYSMYMTNINNNLNLD